MKMLRRNSRTPKYTAAGWNSNTTHTIYLTSFLTAPEAEISPLR